MAGGAVAQAELGEDPREVSGHGVLREGQGCGDLVVPQPAARSPQPTADSTRRSKCPGTVPAGRRSSAADVGIAAPRDPGWSVCGRRQASHGSAGQDIRNDPE
ncbi:hypothetical protein [Streptomyces sp. TN58]|uniref:hypothetical protein n=1 Tax=Streptomyces sp. TN58 TaxID=234612 RepID=UPI0009504BE2|nr:hypothetical protein [Streptomyces sp. TN58]APU43499.1 hypothetical protein BSL84_30875 [Streptomyces sp. TN58]